MAATVRTNLESSVLFIQQEHAKTLKALHEEIAKLQKKYTEVSFQLAMGNLAYDDGGDRLQVSKLEQELTLEKKKSRDLKKDLSVKNSELEQMQKKFRALENEKEFELKMKTRQISSLELELKNKAQSVSDLMAELRSLKLKLAESKHVATGNLPADSSSFPKSLEKANSNESRVSVAGEKSCSPSLNKAEVISSNGQAVSYLLRSRVKKSVASSGSMSGSEDSFALPKYDLEKSSSSFSSKESLSPYSLKGRGSCTSTPQPPKDAAPKLRRRTNVKTLAGTGEKLSSDVLTKSPVVNRPLSGRKVSSVDEVIPDPSPFLTATKSQSATKPKPPLSKKPKVLPPIPCRKSAPQSKDLATDCTETAIRVETATLLPANELSRQANSRMEKSTAVEVLALEKADQLEVRHAAKYNSTANCN